jgi:hypothetical protein
MVTDQHLGLSDDPLHVLQWVIQEVSRSVLMHGHPLSSKPVIRPDDLQVESRTDPHGVGIDQFLAHEGATVAAPVGFHRGVIMHICTISQLGNESLSGLQPEELAGAVDGLAACCPVKVVDVKPAVLVLTDGGGVDNDGGGHGVAP